MYYLSLGHTRDLSILELSELGVKLRELPCGLIATDNSNLLALAPTLGGTTKVFKSLQPTSPNSLLSDLAQIMFQAEGKNFAFSNYSTSPLTAQDLRQLKEEVSLKRPVRLLSFDTSGHSLIALRKQHVTELSLIDDGGSLIIARTAWIQDADAWSHRDRRRPYQDIKRGMLPPKVARMMVNLGTKGKTQLTLLDPFCGTGTVLMEALLLGQNVVGSDNDQSAVEGTLRNLAWLCQENNLQSTPKVFVSDATHLQEKYPDQLDLIVTEPYLGPLLESKSLPDAKKLKNIARGLDKLYRGSLRAWHPLLPSGGRVVIVLPEFLLSGRSIPTLQIDTIASLGYNYLASVAYGKKDAIVVRNITILEKS